MVPTQAVIPQFASHHNKPPSNQIKPTRHPTMMNHNFNKPMSADYARFVVTNASEKQAASNEKKFSKDSSKNTPVDLLDSTSTMTVDSTVSVADLAQDQGRTAATQRKKTWWRQLVLSQSMFAMLKAPGRRG